MSLSDTRGSLAIVHDYLTQRGGAERVVLQLARMFPDAPIFTSLYDQDGTFAEFRDLDVRVSDLGERVRPDHFRRAVLRYPGAFRSFDLSGFDKVVVSTSAFAHHVNHPNTFVYCHTPPRFLYKVESYFPSRALRVALKPALYWLRRGDRAAARRARSYAANSLATQRRITRAYALPSTLIHPPLRTGHLPDALAPAPNEPRALVVARLLPYKRVEVAVQACALAGIPLTVAGEGPERGRLESLGNGFTTFVGRVTDEELAKLFAEHTVVLVPGAEDFGYLPVEAAYSGRPVLAYANGGALETVNSGVTGRLVSTDDPAAWAAELALAVERPWSPQELRAHTGQFSSAGFEQAVRGWLGITPTETRAPVDARTSS